MDQSLDIRLPAQRRRRPRAALTFVAADVAPNRLLNLAGVLLFLAAWQFAAYWARDPATMQGPMEVLFRFLALLTQPFAGNTLEGHLAVSLERFAAGLLLAAALGLPLGLLMGRSKIIAAIVNPHFNVIRFIAPIAWVPFAVLWFGTGAEGALLVIFMGAFPPCVVSARAGALLVDPRLDEATAMLGAGPLRRLWHLVVPSAAPAILSGLRVAMGNAWQCLVGAELIVATSGIAYVMMRGQMNHTIDIVLAGMIAIGLIGLLLDALFDHVERRLRAMLGKSGA